MYPAEQNRATPPEVAPRDVVSLATDQANALMEIVEAKKLYQDIKGKRYLTSEAWATIGAFNSVQAATEYVKAVQDPNGQTIAYHAKVNLLQHGIIIGSAETICGLDEPVCRGKTGMAKHRAAMSAAQTWAASKAFRLNYSWVAVLAGFEPAEDDDDAPEHERQPAAISPDGITDLATFQSYVKARGYSEALIRKALPAPKDVSLSKVVQHWTAVTKRAYADAARRCDQYANSTSGREL